MFSIFITLSASPAQSISGGAGVPRGPHAPAQAGLDRERRRDHGCEPCTVLVTSVDAMAGAWLGARFTAGRVKSATLARAFAVALIALAAQRAWILLT